MVNLEEFKAVLSRKLMRPGLGPGTGLVQGLASGNDGGGNGVTRMRSSSASRAVGSSSGRGLGSGSRVGELILSGEELTSLFDACATDCLGR